MAELQAECRARKALSFTGRARVFQKTYRYTQRYLTRCNNPLPVQQMYSSKITGAFLNVTVLPVAMFFFPVRAAAGMPAAAAFFFGWFSAAAARFRSSRLFVAAVAPAAAPSSPAAAAGAGVAAAAACGRALRLLWRRWLALPRVASIAKAPPAPTVQHHPSAPRSFGPKVRVPSGRPTTAAPRPEARAAALQCARACFRAA